VGLTSLTLNKHCLETLAGGIRLMEEENKFQWEMNVVAVGCCVGVNEQINKDNADIMRSIKASATSQRPVKDTGRKHSVTSRGLRTSRMN
jgi:hypothetical protein